MNEDLIPVLATSDWDSLGAMPAAIILTFAGLSVLAGFIKLLRELKKLSLEIALLKEQAGANSSRIEIPTAADVKNALTMQELLDRPTVRRKRRTGIYNAILLLFVGTIAFSVVLLRASGSHQRLVTNVVCGDPLSGTLGTPTELPPTAAWPITARIERAAYLRIAVWDCAGNVTLATDAAAPDDAYQANTEWSTTILVWKWVDGQRCSRLPLFLLARETPFPDDTGVLLHIPPTSHGAPPADAVETAQEHIGKRLKCEAWPLVSKLP